MFAPKFKFQLSTKAVDAAMDAVVATGGIVATVLNTAQSDDGYYYWNAVNYGRGPIFAKPGKVLSWVDPVSGKRIFATKVRASTPRHMLARALPSIRERCQQEGGKVELSVDGFTQLVLRWAAIAIEELQNVTPVITGKLKASYVADLRGQGSALAGGGGEE